MEKVKKFSYSKLNTYCSCGWKYYLTYQEGHYVFAENITTAYGVLVHWIEQNIGETIKSGKKPDYEKLKNDFMNINIPKASKFDNKGGVYGINILKQMYPEDFIKVNDLGQSYMTKSQDYLNSGIYRLENWMNDHPDYEIFGLEVFFSITYCGEILSGFIDRVLHNRKDNSYIIEDIKTKDKPFKEDDLVTPLQFVVYHLALCNIIGDNNLNISCVYDLPFCDLRQAAGTKGFMERGIKKLKQVFDGIAEGDFEPMPTPLCAWCQFSPTNPNQPDEGKGLCPYYSLWTPNHKTFAVAHKWEGMEKHPQIMQKMIEQETSKDLLNSELGIDFDF